MRMAAHIRGVSQEHELEMRGMERLDLGVLGLGQVVHVVALNRLVQKRQPHQNHGRQDEQEFQSAALLSVLAGFHRSTGRRAAVTSSTRLVRVLCGAWSTSCGSVSTSLAMEIMASIKLSNSSLPSVSVGSIMSAPRTISGKLTV